MNLQQMQPLSENIHSKSQFGEDVKLREHFGHKDSGFFVEVGAYDGVDDSNSLIFERLGWRGDGIRLKTKSGESAE